MANILNAGDIILQATSPRLVATELPDNLIVPAVKEIKLSADAGAFRVTNTGTSNLSEINFLASLIHIDESSTVFITIGSGGTLQELDPNNPDDRTKKLLFSAMTATSVRVTATVTEYPGTDNEETYSSFIDIVKVQDGFDAEYLVVSGDQVFKHLPASVTPVNTSVTLTARLYGHLTQYQWQYYDRLTDPANPAWTNIAGATGSTYNLFYNFVGWGTQNNLSIRCASLYSLNNTTYTDELTVVKIYDGVEGLTPVMPNSSHTIPSNSDGVVSAGSYVGSGTQIQVFDGATAMKFTANSSLAQGEFRITGTTVTPGSSDISTTNTRTALNPNTGVVIGPYSGMSNTVDVVKVTYAIQARRYGDDSGLPAKLINFTLDQTLTKSKAGIDSRSLRISSSGLIFTKQKDYALTPDRILLTAKKQNITVTPTWTNNKNIIFRSQTGSSLTATAVADEVYINKGDLGTNTEIDVTLTATQPNSLGQNPQVFTDTEKVIVVVEGTDGISSSMPNASHALPSNDEGTVKLTDYVGSGTAIRLFEGSEELDYVANILTNDRKKFTIGAAVVTPTNGITVGGYADSTPGMTVADHSNMNPAYSVVTIDYPITIRRANGTNTTLKLTQTITKSKAGIDAKSLKLTTSSLTFKYDKSNTAVPASQTITFKAELQNIVNTDPTYTDPTFTCTLYNADNTLFNNGNNGIVSLGSGANALEKTLTNTQFSTATYAKIECSLLYKQILYTDTQTIQRIKDGADGTPGTSPPRSPFRSNGKTFNIYLDGQPSDFGWYSGSSVSANTNSIRASTVIWRQLGNAGDPPLNSFAHLVPNDEVTLVSADGIFATTRVWSEQSGVLGWYFVGKTIDGNLLVQGTVYADAIQAGAFSSNTVLTRGLEIWTADGTTKVFSAGGLNPDSGVYIKTANIENLNVTSGKISTNAISNTKSIDNAAMQRLTADPIYESQYVGTELVCVGGEGGSCSYVDVYQNVLVGYGPQYWTTAYFYPYNPDSDAWYSNTQVPLVFDDIASNASFQSIICIVRVQATNNNNQDTNVSISANIRQYPNGGWSGNIAETAQQIEKYKTQPFVNIITLTPGWNGPTEVRFRIANSPSGPNVAWYGSISAVVFALKK
jgi:hypothetical protein